MLFVAISDKGCFPEPIEAPDPQAALDHLRQVYGSGPEHDGHGEIRLAILVPQAVATIVANPDSSAATVRFDAYAGVQRTIRNAAAAALQNNLAYLAAQTHTNAEVAAQVAALTRQVDGLIRLALGDLTDST